uniref:Uncharacterized protein n=1 Tax=Arundo donax TaxID=35708 RepID=A0A0A9UQ01_ARUDO
MLPRSEERAAVRLRTVREPVGDSGRLHHHRQHQHALGEARELLPPGRLRRRRLQPFR